MKSISLEGLRRLMKGNKEKQNGTQDTQNFRRSNSFKRASLRKSSRRQDKITLPNGLVVKTSAVQRKTSVSSDDKPDDGYSTDGETGGSSSTATRRVITYDEWVAAASDEETAKRTRTDDSCPSTLSTNKLSSLDSGVRHSLDSKKRFSVDSSKHDTSLSYFREHSDKLDMLPSNRDLPNRRSLESNFRRSVSNDSPASSMKLKNILGSPKVAPKHTDPSASGASGGVSYSVHNTPNRSRILVNGNIQPMSAPSTPGKIHKINQGNINMTPAQQLRSSFHERERFCAVHGTMPDSPRLHKESKPSNITDSPKTPSRWSSMFSGSIFSRSPVKAKLNQYSVKDSPLRQVPSTPQHRPVSQDSPSSVSRRNIYSCNGSPAVTRQLSVQSIHASPSMNRAYGFMHGTLGPSSLNSNFGVARAIGGMKSDDSNPRSMSGLHSFNSPLNIKRQISQPVQSVCSPSPIQRHSSVPYGGVPSPRICRLSSTASPVPVQPLNVQASPKAFQVLGENPGVVNSSQFYPGKIGKGLVAALPSVSVVGGRTISADRVSSRNTPDKSVQLRTFSAERPKTPTPSSKFSLHPWGRPLSLAFNCAGKNDLMSPCSITSEASSRGSRKKGPSLLVSRKSWFSRYSSARKSSSKSMIKKRVQRYQRFDPPLLIEEEIPPPPPLPARMINPRILSYLKSNNAQATDSIIFVPPQRRKSSHGLIKGPSLCDIEQAQRTAHVNLLMPLNQPVGSPNNLAQISSNLTNLISSNCDQTKEESMRDTNSEPGGAKFSVAPKKGKPKSAPNTTRLNVKAVKNPETLFRVLGISSPIMKGWRKESKGTQNTDKERVVTEVLLRKLLEDSNKLRQNTSPGYAAINQSQTPPINNGSLESLVSIVESVVSSHASNNSQKFKEIRKIRRRRSQKTLSVPAYPSWKRTGRQRSTRFNSGDITQKGYEKKKARLLGPYVSKEKKQAMQSSSSGHSSQHHHSGAGSRSRRAEHRNITAHEQRYLSGGGGGPLVSGGSSSPSTRSRRRAHRRVTRNESRYHSEVRQEAVKEALAQYQSRPKNLPLPSKRSSFMTPRSPDKQRHDSDSDDSDDDSVTAEGSLGSSGSHSHGTPEVNRAPVLLPPPQLQTALPPVPSHGTPLPPPPSSTSSSSTGSGGRHHNNPSNPLPSKQQQPLPPIPPHSRITNGDEEERRKREMTEMTDLMRNITTYSQPPDVTNNTGGNNIRSSREERISRYTPSQPSLIRNQTPLVEGGTITDGWRDAVYNFPENWRGTGRWKVSSKIQQLLNTLKRPKRRPLPEFYVDDEEDLEIAANPKDPLAPKPEGKIMNPARGEQLVIPAGLPRSVEDAVYRYGSSSGYKAPVATVLDANGKLSVSLTYGKLLSRSQKMAYNLLTRLGGRGEGSVQPGDRVALVYPNNDPITFLCAFYACLQAGLVPVPIEVPISRRDAGSLQIGFLLGSCGVSVALTSEACFKGLPKTSSGEVASFKGWPKLNWFITDHLPKPPKDWLPPPRMADDSPAYTEYTTDKDGAVKGVVVQRSAMLAHCRTLTSACNYTEGEVAVCVLDFKREVGLWHSMLCSVFNGMHVVFIPYSVMKVNPASWMHMITKFKASIAIVKSRDLHWGLLATKDHKDVNLSSLRLLLVADGANPWSLSSCDQFLAVFQSKGLRPDAICPCASSPEALTVSVRRPGHGGANAVGRGVLSMQGLSYGVVRVDQENSLTSLTLQDCGQVLPGSSIVVVRLEGSPYLCQTDEVGEICVSGPAVGTQYWGLKGLSNTTFRVQPLLPDDSLYNEPITYVRSGLLGFLGPGGLVFVCGSRDGLMTVTARKHNTDDIIATVLAVEPMKFIYRGRIAVFSHKVLRDERICVIAEQRPDCSEEESFQWMSRVLQAVDSIHQVGIYCLALVPPNHLPKTPLGGIHLSETKKKFLEGSLHPANVLMCPHTCVTNLPKPREVHHDVGPASVMVGNLVQGNRLAMAQGRDIGLLDDDDMARRHPQFIAEILKWRASTTENHEILVLLNAKGQVATSLTCSQLHKKAERVGVLLLEKGHINTGDHVALIYPPGIDLIVAFYGCLYVGAVPVTIRPPHPQNLQSTVNTVRTVVDVSKSSLVLSTQSVIKLLKNKEEKFDTSKKWPTILDTDELPKKKLPAIYKVPTPEMIAYLDFSVSTTGMLAGIKVSHASATSLCLSMKVACELYPSRVVALCLDPYCGLGLALWVLSSVYSGHQTILIPPSEVEVNAALWLSAVSQYKVRDTFCSYGVMELCTKGLGSSIPTLKQRGVNLSCVRTCVVVAEERPRILLTTSFSKLFNSLGLSPRAVSTSFGCRVNVAVCLQGASSPDPTTVFVDLRSLRHDRVTLVERGAPHSLCIMESGKLLPGTKVVIANPDTRGQCSDSHLGEIWVQSAHNASGYFYDGTSQDHFNAQLVTGGTGETYSRTGYLGFLRRTESVQADGELHDAVFVVGSLDETIILRGLRYHPIDVESTVFRCHKKIAECAVFTWTNLLVVVVELDGQEYEALDLVPLITSSVLEEHQVIVGVIVVVDPGVVPINSRGEKQRMHLRDGFLADQLDPIYVAYNM